MKDDVDKLIKSNEEEQLKKDKLRKKRIVYSQDELINISLQYKPYLKREPFPVKIYGIKYLFDIDGIGNEALKLGKFFPLIEIFNSKPNSVEGKIKKLIFKVLNESLDNFEDFTNKLKSNENKLDYSVISILVGNKLFEFTLIFYPDFVKLVQFIRYENIMRKFNNNENCMETILKIHVETFKPKLEDYDYSSEIRYLKNNGRRYKRPKVSKKEDFETIKKNLSRKDELIKNHSESKSYISNSRSSDLTRILR